MSSTQIHIRVTEEEKNQLKLEASKVKMTLQDYCLARLTKDPVIFHQLITLLSTEREVQN